MTVICNWHLYFINKINCKSVRNCNIFILFIIKPNLHYDDPINNWIIIFLVHLIPGQIVICPPKPSTPKPADEMIPLHAGSNVYISKSDLVRIFTPNPSLYTSRLADLIFSQELREASTKQGKDRLSLLDQTRLSSLISIFIGFLYVLSIKHVYFQITLCKCLSEEALKWVPRWWSGLWSWKWVACGRKH